MNLILILFTELRRAWSTPTKTSIKWTSICLVPLKNRESRFWRRAKLQQGFSTVRGKSALILIFPRTRILGSFRGCFSGRGRRLWSILKIMRLKFISTKLCSSRLSWIFNTRICTPVGRSFLKLFWMIIRMIR